MKSQGEIDFLSQRELDLLIRRRGNGCPNDVDGDCYLCARDPKFHWRVTAARMAQVPGKRDKTVPHTKVRPQRLSGCACGYPSPRCVCP